MPNYTPSTINPLKCSNTKLTTISYTMTSADLPIVWRDPPEDGYICYFKTGAQDSSAGSSRQAD